jgi:hypothetical protein
MHIKVTKFISLNQQSPNYQDISSVLSAFIALEKLNQIAKLSETQFNNPDLTQQILYAYNVSVMIYNIKNISPAFAEKYPTLKELYNFIKDNDFREVQLALETSIFSEEASQDVHKIMQRNFEKTYLPLRNSLENILGSLVTEEVISALPEVVITGTASKKLKQIETFAEKVMSRLQMDPALAQIFQDIIIYSFLLNDYSNIKSEEEFQALIYILGDRIEWRLAGYQNLHNEMDSWRQTIKYLKTQFQYLGQEGLLDKLSSEDRKIMTKYLLDNIIPRTSAIELTKAYPGTSIQGVFQEKRTEIHKKKSSKKSDFDYILEEFIQSDIKFHIWTKNGEKLSDRDAALCSGYIAELFLRIIKLASVSDETLGDIYTHLPKHTTKALDADTGKSLQFNKGPNSYIKTDQSNIARIHELISMISTKVPDFMGFFDNELLSQLLFFFEMSSATFYEYLSSLHGADRDIFVKDFGHDHGEYWQVHRVSNNNSTKLKYFTAPEFLKRQKLITIASDLLLKVAHHPLFDNTIKVPADIIIFHDIAGLCNGKNVIHNIGYYGTEASKTQHLGHSIPMKIAPINALMYGLSTEKIFWSLIINGANFGDKPSLIGATLALNLKMTHDKVVDAIKILYGTEFSDQDLHSHLQDKLRLIHEHTILMSNVLSSETHTDQDISTILGASGTHVEGEPI